ELVAIRACTFHSRRSRIAVRNHRTRTTIGVLRVRLSADAHVQGPHCRVHTALPVSVSGQTVSISRTHLPLGRLPGGESTAPSFYPLLVPGLAFHQRHRWRADQLIKTDKARRTLCLEALNTEGRDFRRRFVYGFLDAAAHRRSRRATRMCARLRKNRHRTRFETH